MTKLGSGLHPVVPQILHDIISCSAHILASCHSLRAERSNTSDKMKLPTVIATLIFVCWIESVRCSGKASHSSRLIIKQYTQVLHITCTEPCSEGAVQLVSGTHSLEGRLEVCANGQWGTVCNDGFDNNAAKVVCRQLGIEESGIWLHNITIHLQTQVFVLKVCMYRLVVTAFLYANSNSY